MVRDEISDPPVEWRISPEQLALLREINRLGCFERLEPRKNEDGWSGKLELEVWTKYLPTPSIVGDLYKSIGGLSVEPRLDDRNLVLLDFTKAIYELRFDVSDSHMVCLSVSGADCRGFS